MKLTRLVIRQLFNQFDYDISFENKENILILTGANGTGKTTILDMIQQVVSFLKNDGSSRKLSFLSPLKETRFYFDNGLYVEINDIQKIFQNDTEVQLLNLPKINLDTYFIKDDRIKKFRSYTKHRYTESGLKSVIQQELAFTISIIAEKLVGLLKETELSVADLAVNLDASFPKRLLNEKRRINKEEFDVRFKKIQEKQERLKEYGLSDGKQADTEFSIEDAKTLLVYLNDIETKLSVYDDLLARLDLFTTILNYRRFFNKKIKINKEDGFHFITNQEEPLDAEKLSSGEQHQVILLYELLFSTEENMLVLIDEPEISLHVSWQKSFVDDLLEIMKLRKMQVIIATHSPDIVNGHWNLVHTLNPSPSQEA